VEQMTVNSDKRYYSRYPEYPSYDEQIQAKDNMIAQHAGLKFTGALPGSLEWDTDNWLWYRPDRG